ncbi:MAG: vitamin K epoxide reductase family protein [Patescibacteria group bacterium]|nr:vitamin K epoxide reductase family protein [Patescibacteria group bacterium]MDE1988305.1 vitamin K epoxide reductase family protein [Patescibacteria group bacterium]MDE2218657.1 vitamin K epoxide reductase family protein [Patescibacteria group bacterium]
MTYSAKTKIIAITFIVLSLIGFLDAAYLTIDHYLGSVPPCAIAGCEIVLTSGQSAIIGIPVALLGSIYYLIILILSIVFLESGKRAIIRFASFLTIIGLVASAYFIYLQFFVIGQICQYCMISAGTSTTLFVAGIYTFRRAKENKS